MPPQSEQGETILGHVAGLRHAPGISVSAAVRAALSQRADLTHKPNLRAGRHGWLRLTPAYSVRIVTDLIAREDRPLRVFDPFCGTATTALSAAAHGHEAVTLDINPFLVWLGRAKTAHYSVETLAAAKDAGRQARALAEREAVAPAPAPPLHNVGRWWTPPALAFLCRLRAAIDTVTPPRSPERDLLLVAFCRTLIALSSAAFNHQSLSFKDAGSPPPDPDFGAIFAADLRFVLDGAAENPPGRAAVLLGDARHPAASVTGLFDRVITSPPYANRMSYIRELRPYMYWLGFLKTGRDAGELDWAAIGGTWGIATSRLGQWQRPAESFRPAWLDDVLDQIATRGHKSSHLLAAYVGRYADDMWQHFRALPALLAPGATVHYIIGNSTFYGVLLPTERLYAEMLAALGFTDVSYRPIRKRNSKQALLEFDVSARWPG
ncbi:MAG TPA: hypothetical protein VIL01_09020 [Thermomicrobiales bacterium]